jgi:hypothetical protein
VRLEALVHYSPDGLGYHPNPAAPPIVGQSEWLAAAIISLAFLSTHRFAHRCDLS